MKICGCTVIFNPDELVYYNILTYCNSIDKLFVIDNSNKNNDIIEKIKNIPKCEYVKMNGNEGIAKALKVGLKKANNDKYDWCLTMDQDSKFPKEKYKEIKEYLRRYSNYGIIGLNYDKKFKTSKDLLEVKTWITSGNFINLYQYNKIDGFNEDLFIDYVDFDLCNQFYKKDIKIGIISEIYIEHKIGNPITIRILGNTFNCMNHKPIRYYYRYRNSRYLYKKDKKFYYKIYYHEMIVDFLKMIFFEKDKKNKIKMIKKGLKDANKNKLGVYNSEYEN